MKTNTVFKIITFIIILLNIVSCTKLGILNGSLVRIKNTTDSEVELRLHHNNDQGNSVSILNGGPGEVLIEARQLDGERTAPEPTELFKVDSIVVVFNNEKFETHDGTGRLAVVPNSMLFGVVFYEFDEEKNEYTYEIDQENYDNAEPCIDGC